LPAPPPPPPPPVWDGERTTLPNAADDLAYIGARTGRSAANVALIDWTLDLAQLARGRLERDLPRGYIDVWLDERRRMVVNVRPGFDRAAILARIHPRLHPTLRLRTVVHDRAAIERGRSLLIERLTRIGGGFVLSFDARSDRFQVAVPRAATIASLRRTLPRWIVRGTLFEIGEPPVLV
jgi:hypothetical protein